jgi:hypothetical protein
VIGVADQHKTAVRVEQLPAETWRAACAGWSTRPRRLAVTLTLTGRLMGGSG